MRGHLLLITLAVVTTVGCQPKQAVPSVSNATAPASAPVARDEALRSALLERVKSDQAVRQKITALFQVGAQTDSLRIMPVIAEQTAVDRANTEWLKSVVAKRGWPGRSLVGIDGAKAAFLLVQHADRDTAFQASVLPLLGRAYANGDVTGEEIALLTDRVATARGQPQVYGSQFKLVNSRFVLDPIADSANVDARRKRVGLPPLREYVRVLDSVYTAQPKR